MTWLLDGSVLIALAIEQHQFHHRCSDWFAANVQGVGKFATCPLTEGTLLRLHMMLDPEHGSVAAWQRLHEFQSLTEHEFWSDSFSYGELAHTHLQGHRQVTDAWLVELARRRGGKLATLDAALAVLYPDVVELVPVVL